MRRSVTLFARLILWGTQAYQAPWKPSCAPGEYCALLAARVVKAPPAGTSSDGAELSGTIIRCGELFERALYSKQVLSGEEGREFAKLTFRITGGKDKPA
jgi:hypothetical protein